MSNASTPGTSNQVARFLAPETHRGAVFATTLYAQPYNIDATGFYFHNADDYRTRSEGLRDCYGSPVEEFEIQYIDGDDAQLFEACGINQSNLDQWFDDIETLDDREKVALYYLTADAGCTLDNAMDKIDDVCLYEGRLQEAAEELFDENGRVHDWIADLAPSGTLRMSDNPHTNGGLLLKDLRLPDFREYGVDVPAPGATLAEATKVLGQWLTDVIRLNPENFRIFGPDETASNRLQPVFEVTDKQWNAEFFGPEVDDHLARAGRVVEMLSEHQMQGWLEGYLLTGRHGLFNCYEAFIHIIDSMFNQHAKWLKTTDEIPWRRPIASLNYLLSSHVWRQDHNGFSHQDPGFIDHVVNKSATVVRVYLPPDANTLLSTYDHCLRSRQYVNVVVAGKQPHPNFLTMDEAVAHCTRGLGIWEWAGTEVHGKDPDVILACAGDVPTLEALAAADLLRQNIPELGVRFINVVDLMRLQDESEHPHGLSNREFDMYFTADKPVIFAYHGYPWLIHRLVYRRSNDARIHVRGYKEEGTTTTPFDMVMLNDLDRYHLVIDVIDRVPGLGSRYAVLRQQMQDKRIQAREYTRAHGDDIPEVRDWVWPAARGVQTDSSMAATLATGGDNE